MDYKTEELELCEICEMMQDSGQIVSCNPDVICESCAIELEKEKVKNND
jgi:hypothetical protein